MWYPRGHSNVNYTHSNYTNSNYTDLNYTDYFDVEAFHHREFHANGSGASLNLDEIKFGFWSDINVTDITDEAQGRIVAPGF